MPSTDQQSLNVWSNLKRRERNTAHDGADARSPEFERHALLPRLLVFGILITAAFLDDGPGHHQGHWILLAGYAVSTITVAWRVRSGQLERMLPWVSTLLDAFLAIYVLAEHLPAKFEGAHHASDAVSELPAFLFLLQNSLRLRYDHVLTFAGLVVSGWAGALAVAYGVPASAKITGSSETITHQLFGLVAFAAAAIFVLLSVRRMRQALLGELKAQRERAYFARFVPRGLGIDILRTGQRKQLRDRHVCLMAVDIRGFSILTRRHDPADVLTWLLDLRAVVNGIVTARHGLVDKYIGDGVLALFLEGTANAQASNALAAALDIRAHLDQWNAQRNQVGLPSLRLITTLHAGDVLAGVFDDGLRAEFTVLGPAMNALSRIERRAKEEGHDLVASKRFVRLLNQQALTQLHRDRLPRRSTDRDLPDVMAIWEGADCTKTASCPDHREDGQVSGEV
ncbi:adenylate/guanylate cyclase domain-containing protein [Microvirga arsenatis]|uniref:Adenylate/guanylate cyclase domain-containing protein n=1 Tax=Microvirga arsenatis TaxID=2692265 RepID=A0ABW9Z775_9HYPH|nr:adenylate/guanylate cyclase domain-containing protein [Microvirga arsenatis]NBJ13590.1 adenylate/guanylate cyclase domain-containing protein [Microvirga arsenatis]NBJ27063.1 adenylate/guanylate cyclase domain-containing protein [Microvirga arsenatis]